jgi:hypothetical protein
MPTPWPVTSDSKTVARIIQGIMVDRSNAMSGWRGSENAVVSVMVEQTVTRRTSE